jgi:hypothetical protein
MHFGVTGLDPCYPILKIARLSEVIAQIFSSCHVEMVRRTKHLLQ